MSIYAYTYPTSAAVALVKTGMPEECVRIAIGDTLEEAFTRIFDPADGGSATPIQSAGQTPEDSAVEWAFYDQWFGDEEEPPKYNKAVTERANELWEQQE